jgi:hypothetical protein
MVGEELTIERLREEQSITHAGGPVRESSSLNN